MDFGPGLLAGAATEAWTWTCIPGLPLVTASARASTGTIRTPSDWSSARMASTLARKPAGTCPKSVRTPYMESVQA